MSTFITNHIHEFVLLFSILASLCIIALIINLSRMIGNKTDTKVYISTNGVLKEKKSIINYNSIRSFLVKQGCEYHYPFLADPANFLSATILAGALGCCIGMFLSPLLIPVGLILGLSAPVFFITSSNKQDNKEILEDIKIIYNSLYNQLKAGVYVSDALTECVFVDGSERMIKSDRLYKEMQKLSANIYLTSDIRKSMENFSKSFDNVYIESLKIVITQAMESGMASEALNDISKQLKVVEKNLLALKNEKRRTRNMLFELCLLFGIMITIFVVVFPKLLSMVSIM